MCKLLNLSLIGPAQSVGSLSWKTASFLLGIFNFFQFLSSWPPMDRRRRRSLPRGMALWTELPFFFLSFCLACLRCLGLGMDGLGTSHILSTYRRNNLLLPFFYSQAYSSKTLKVSWWYLGGKFPWWFQRSAKTMLPVWMRMIMMAFSNPN